MDQQPRLPQPQPLLPHLSQLGLRERRQDNENKTQIHSIHAVRPCFQYKTFISHIFHVEHWKQFLLLASRGFSTYLYSLENRDEGISEYLRKYISSEYKVHLGADTKDFLKSIFSREEFLTRAFTFGSSLSLNSTTGLEFMVGLVCWAGNWVPITYAVCTIQLESVQYIYSNDKRKKMVILLHLNRSHASLSTPNAKCMFLLPGPLVLSLGHIKSVRLFFVLSPHWPRARYKGVWTSGLSLPTDVWMKNLRNQTSWKEQRTFHPPTTITQKLEFRWLFLIPYNARYKACKWPCGQPYSLPIWVSLSSQPGISWMNERVEVEVNLQFGRLNLW